jgi:TfoX/Sxy family transcriptional regulator of competence genes
MAYDEGLAQRIRELLDDDPRISEKKMFGGVAFLVNGKMGVGIIQDELMVRVGPEAFEDALAQPHARAMDFTGRPMRGFVQVAPAGFEEDAELRAWLVRGIAGAEESEAKPRAPKPRRARPASRRRRK